MCRLKHFLDGLGMDQLYSHRTLYAIDSMKRAPAPETVLDIFDKTLADLGADYFGIHFLPRPEDRLDDMSIVCKVPPDWRRLYDEGNFCQHDPSIRYSRHTVLPFDWASSPYNRETEPLAKEVMDRARDFNVHKGVVVPIPSPCGVVGGVWIGGPDFDDREIFRPILQLLGLHVFHRLEHLSGRRFERVAGLTEREREVMAWAAEGKTAWEIGCILGISHRTVETYFYHACKKLGASNRIQAVAIWGGRASKQH
jgi:LuxR family quorum sensing-dependent transcriptional regulator